MAELTAMRNIGKEMARKLAAVGIETPEQLAQAGAEEAGLIGGVEETQVPELFMGGPGDGLGLFIERFGGNLVAPELVKEVQQLAEKGGLSGGTAVDRQFRQDLQQSLFQSQQLAPRVQGHLGGAAGDAENPVREAAEAQHLGVAAGGVSASPAEVHLRLVGGVLGNQENLLPPAGAGGNAAKHRLRFAGLGPAGQQRQHRKASLGVSCQIV